LHVFEWNLSKTASCVAYLIVPESQLQEIEGLWKEITERAGVHTELFTSRRDADQWFAAKID